MNNMNVLSFDKVSFYFDHKKPILEEVSFSVKKNSKITIMGQNGAGKSTILKLIEGQHKAKDGKVNTIPGLTIATAHQVVRQEDRDLTVLEFFEQNFDEKIYDIERRIDGVLDAVNLHAPYDRIIKSFSGGQQARLLLAAALIQDADLLLLDEPTNNLDAEGIGHLTAFLIMYEKTCMVISHDADFLNTFTEGVLYLDAHTQKVEQYAGDYFDVVDQIKRRIDKENMKNAQMEKGIQKNKDQANVFAHKGGKLRLVAKKMRMAAEEMEAQKVDVRREDKTIRDFKIPVQSDLSGAILTLSEVSIIRNHEAKPKAVEMDLRKNEHLLLEGPNGIGKSTLLEAIASGEGKGSVIAPGVRVGYYRQDFSTLNFEHTAFESLMEAYESSGGNALEEDMRRIASGFLFTNKNIRSQVGHLSEGQKGLLAFARLVLQSPGLLVLDEPTNHINFRHLPIIAKALHDYEGAMIVVSHVPEFLEQIRIDKHLDLGRVD
jgi:ATPase subunit of ABC transporter with duplicated ATPase domains